MGHRRTTIALVLLALGLLSSSAGAAFASVRQHRSSGRPATATGGRAPVAGAGNEHGHDHEWADGHAGDHGSGDRDNAARSTPSPRPDNASAPTRTPATTPATSGTDEPRTAPPPVATPTARAVERVSTPRRHPWPPGRDRRRTRPRRGRAGAHRRLRPGGLHARRPARRAVTSAPAPCPDRGRGAAVAPMSFEGLPIARFDRLARAIQTSTDGPSAARRVDHHPAGSVAGRAPRLLAAIVFPRLSTAGPTGAIRSWRARGSGPRSLDSGDRVRDGPRAQPVSDRLLVLQFVRLLIVVALLVIPRPRASPRARLAVDRARCTSYVVAASRCCAGSWPQQLAGLVSWTVLVDGAGGGARRRASPAATAARCSSSCSSTSWRSRSSLRIAPGSSSRCGARSCCSSPTPRPTPVSIDEDRAGRRPLRDRERGRRSSLFALCAALFSAVNERALRHSRGQLEWLVELGAELERAIRTDDVMSTLVRHSCARLGFTRSVGARAHAATCGRASRRRRRRGARPRCPTSPRRSCYEAWSIRRPDARAHGRRRPARPGAPGRAERRRRARSPPTASTSAGRRRRVGRRQRRPHPDVDGAGARPGVDAHRARAAQRASARRDRAPGDRATRSPGSPTAACSTSRSSGRRRGRNASARRSACSCSTSTTSSRSTTPTGTRPATRCCARSPTRSSPTPRTSTSRRATAATSSSCCCPGAVATTRCGSPTACAGEIARAGGRSAGHHQRRASRPMPDNATDAERLMAAADAALYDAKRTGRDRVAGSGRNSRWCRLRRQLVGSARGGAYPGSRQRTRQARRGVGGQQLDRERAQLPVVGLARRRALRASRRARNRRGVL